MFKNAQKPMPVWNLVITDLLLFGICLVVFAYFHHVRPTGNRQPNGIYTPPTFIYNPPTDNSQDNTPDNTGALNTAGANTGGNDTPTPIETDVTQTPVTSLPSATDAPVTADDTKATPTPVITPVPDYSYLGMGAKFYNKFNLDGSITKTDTSYVSGRVAVYYSTIRYKNANCHIADIYICDITSFRTVLANDRTYSYESVESMGLRNNAIVAVNGDYYGLRKNNNDFIVRNGMMYYDKNKPKSEFDVCILYGNGEMRSYFYKDFNPNEAINRGVWQAWVFGPKLLDDGKPVLSPYIDSYSGILNINPRTVLGYYEPGHYCIVCVDGRSSESYGLSMENLALFMSEQLGCKDAYNLDGGDTSVMYFNGKLANVRSGSGKRTCSDAVIIVG